jgi:hypothetical protein
MNWEFQDPAKIVERREMQREHQSCSGCIHWTRLWGVVICRKHEGRAGAAVQVCVDFVRKADKRQS